MRLRYQLLQVLLLKNKAALALRFSVAVGLCLGVTYPLAAKERNHELTDASASQKKFRELVIQREANQIRINAKARGESATEILKKHRQLHNINLQTSDLDAGMLRQVRSLASVINSNTFDVNSIKQHFDVEFADSKKVEVTGVVSYRATVANRTLEVAKDCLRKFEFTDPKREYDTTNIETTVTFGGAGYDSRIRLLDQFPDEPGLSVLLVPHYFDIQGFTKLPESIVERSIQGSIRGVFEVSSATADSVLAKEFLRTKKWRRSLSNDGEIFSSMFLNKNTVSGASSNEAGLPVNNEELRSNFYAGQRFESQTSDAKWVVYYRLLRLEDSLLYDSGRVDRHCGEWVVEKRSIKNGGPKIAAASQVETLDEQQVKLITSVVNVQSLVEVKSSLKAIGSFLRLEHPPSTKIPKAAFILSQTNNPTSMRGLQPTLEVILECKTTKNARLQTTPMPCSWSEKRQRFMFVPKFTAKSQCLNLRRLLGSLSKSQSVFFARTLPTNTRILTWEPYTEVLSLSRSESWINYLSEKRKRDPNSMPTFDYFLGTNLEPGALVTRALVVRSPMPHEIPLLLKVVNRNKNSEAFIDALVNDDDCILALQITNTL